MRPFLCLFAVLLLLGGAPIVVQAQQAVDPMEEGILAFRGGDYSQAVSAFERAIALNAQNAEAHFLLARVYFETPLKDVKKAGQLLDKAILLEPDNVVYLVARLEQMRAESWNFLADKVREQRRRTLATRILEVDPENAFAHEELGSAYIRDFWRYRNAFMYPMLKFGAYDYRQGLNYDPMAEQLAQQLDQIDDLSNPDLSNPFDGGVGDMGNLGFIGNTPNEVFLADQFDLDKLESQGIPVQDLSKRAQRSYERAIGHLKKALEVDPRRESAYDELMKIYTLKGEWTEALAMLQEMYVFFPEDLKLWLYLGLAHYHAGNMDPASKAFESAQAYMDDEVAHAFSTLDNIIPVNERDRYKEDPVAYASRFWTSKDPRFLTPYNERKLEHYSRLIYADILYGAPVIGLRGWNTERGSILVRYGVPQADVTIIPKSTSGVSQSLAPSTTGEVQSDRQVGEVFSIYRSGSDFDMLNEANTFNIWDYGEFQFVFEDPFRNGEYRLFSPSASEISQGSLPWVNDYTIKAKDTFRKTPERYEYKAPGRQIEMPYLVNAFKGPDGSTKLYVNYGIPILEYNPKEELIGLTANTGTFLINDNRDILVERRRTIYGLRTAQIVSFEETDLWVDTQSMDAPPGNLELSVEFETASGGTVAVQRRALQVPNFATDRLALSDVMLAYRVEETFDGEPATPGDIVRDGLSIQPAPWSVFSNDQPIYLYFEIYNLERDASGQTNYDIEAILVPKEDRGGVGKFVKGLFGGGKKGVAVSLPGTGNQPDESQYIILDAANQETGLYTLVVRIRDNIAKRNAESEHDLFLE